MMKRISHASGRALLIPVLGALLVPLAWSQDVDDLAALSLETLMDIEVTSVSRREELLQNTAAAAYVLTAEDIRRSGARDIAEVLRMSPGVNVARIDGNTWAISIRGFNQEYANKLLVLVDGRSVYDPTFSGVFWHLQNLALEDIERIEVIRGPGASMWGANAVNGVISVTTKRAGDTRGGLFVAGAGSDSPGEGVFRYGGAIGATAEYRIYGRQTTRLASSTESGDNGQDSWNVTTGGYRVDWQRSAVDSFTISGDAYRSVLGNQGARLVAISPPAYEGVAMESDRGGHALFRWDHAFAGSDLILQAYYDYRDEGGSGGKTLGTFDFDLQHAVAFGERHRVVWGIGHREIRDKFDSSLSFSLDPPGERTRLSSVFLQDEIAIIPEKLYLTLGSRFERSSFAGANVQPTVRVVWRPTFRQSVWASASRAVRTPSRVERGMVLNVSAFPAGPQPGVVSIRGQEDTRSEVLTAYEAGYRYQADRRIWLDVAAFYNEYDYLTTVGPGTPFSEASPSPPHTVFPQFFGNDADGETYGLEAVVGYEISPFWHVEGSYSHLRIQLHRTPGADPSVEEVEGESPRHQAHLASLVNLPSSFELSAHAYIAGRLPAFGVPGYTRIDLNLAWKRFENVELGVSGYNLTGSHREFGDAASSVHVGPGVFGKISWAF